MLREACCGQLSAKEGGRQKDAPPFRDFWTGRRSDENAYVTRAKDLAAARRGCGSGDIAGSAPKSPRGSHVLGISTWAKRAAHSEGALGAEQGVMGLGLWGQILRLLGSYRSGYTEGCLSLDLAGPTVQAFARD